MGGDFSKGGNSPIDTIRNLAHKSFTAKMEKAFATLQELIILKMEANESKLLMPKNQFLEIMMNVGFVLDPDEDGDLVLTKQIQFIIDRELRVWKILSDGSWYLFGSEKCSFYLEQEDKTIILGW